MAAPDVAWIREQMHIARGWSYSPVLPETVLALCDENERVREALKLLIKAEERLEAARTAYYAGVWGSIRELHDAQLEWACAMNGAKEVLK